MAVEDYTQAMRYEMLVRNTFNCPRGSRNGAELSFMQNAMTMERGETFAKNSGSFQKQFDKVKNYLFKALIKLTKTKPYSKESYFFQKLVDQLEYSTTTNDLMAIVNPALDKIIELRE